MTEKSQAKVTSSSVPSFSYTQLDPVALLTHSVLISSRRLNGFLIHRADAHSTLVNITLAVF